MDGVGLMLASIMTKSDITSAVPRVSIGTDERKHTDFSERDTWGQQSYHHGYGANIIEDPYTFQDSENVVTWIQDQLILAPIHEACEKTTGGSTDLKGYPVDQLPFEGNLFVLVYGTVPADNALYLYNNTTDSLDAVTAGLDTTTGEPSDLHAFDGSLFVAQGETVDAQRFDGSSWTSNEVPAKFYESFDGYLWRADNLHELYYSADPTEDVNATWQGPIEIGDRSYPIRGMVAGFDGALWVGKDDGIYVVRKITEVNYSAVRIIDLTASIHETNGQAMIEYGGNLYFSVGVTLARYDGSSIQYVGPDRGAHDTKRFDAFTDTRFNNLSPTANTGTYQAGVTGVIRKLAHDNNFLYAAVDNEGDASSRVMLWTGTGWHTVFKTTGSTRVRFVDFTRPLASTGTLSYPQLWWDDSSGSVYNHQKQSKFSHNPLDEATIKYSDSGHIITAWWDAGLLDLDKSIFDFVLNATALAIGGNSVTIEFQVDDYDTWYTLGTISRTPESTLYFPDNSQLDPSIFVRKIRYRITLTRDDGSDTTTPIVKSWGHRFVVRPQSRYGWNFTVKAYENFDDLRRRTHTDQSNQIRRFLYGLRDKRTPIQLFDGTELLSLTNEVTNPSVELDSNADGRADGITAVGSGVTCSMTAQYKSGGVLGQKVALSANGGTKGIQIGTNYAVTAGQKVFAAADIYLVGGGAFVRLEVLDGNDNVVANVQYRPSTITGETVVRFQRQYVFFDAPSTGNYKFRIVRTDGDGTSATTFYVDQLEFICDEADFFTEFNGDYIDGDQIRCRWNGTPHASTSTRQAGYFVYITTFTETLRYIEDKKFKTVIESEFALSAREMQ